MPHDIDLILTITGGLTAALILGLITQRLRMSPIVGYVLAGVSVGPFTPGVVVKTDIALELAELGVVLLMFGVGLHFAFAMLFFVSVGMLLDPSKLVDNAALIVATFAVVVIAESLVAFVVVRLLRTQRRRRCLWRWRLRRSASSPSSSATRD